VIEVAQALARATHIDWIVVIESEHVVMVAHKRLAAPKTLNANLTDGSIVAMWLCAILVDDAPISVDGVTSIV